MDRFGAFKAVLENLGIEVSAQTTLLDFGCGSGELVASATSQGIDAYGCDIEFSQVWVDQDLLEGLVRKNRVKRIASEERDNPRLSPQSSAAYRLPFDDGTFDVVISDQVLEHVFNYADVVRELHRVMKPGAAFLHMFPPRLSLIEVHINVPFAGAFNPDWWLKLWAKLGVRNIYQRDLSPKETVDWNREFLEGVNYLTRPELEDAFKDSFELKFVESEFFKVSKRARVFLHPGVYSGLRSRVMFGIRRGK